MIKVERMATQWEPVIVDISKFPDNTPHINMVNINGYEVYRVTWHYESMEELFNVYSIIRKLQDDLQKNVTIKLLLTYIPNARQDRVKRSEDTFTLKYFTEIINSLNIEVDVIDPHSDVSIALLNNVKQIRISPAIQKAIFDCNPDMLFYPDNGAAKKYSDFINFPYGFGVKDRDWETGKIKGLQVFGDVKDKRILIVDDICSKGGTFYHAAKKLIEFGAKEVYLYITHCEKAIFEGELIHSGLIKQIYTTNTIYKDEYIKTFFAEGKEVFAEENKLIKVIYNF